MYNRTGWPIAGLLGLDLGFLSALSKQSLRHSSTLCIYTLLQQCHPRLCLLNESAIKTANGLPTKRESCQFVFLTFPLTAVNLSAIRA